MRSLEFNMQRKYVTNNKLTVINIEKPLKLEEKRKNLKYYSKSSVCTFKFCRINLLINALYIPRVRIVVLFEVYIPFTVYSKT